MIESGIVLVDYQGKSPELAAMALELNAAYKECDEAARAVLVAFNNMGKIEIDYYATMHSIMLQLEEVDKKIRDKYQVLKDAYDKALFNEFFRRHWLGEED